MNWTWPQFLFGALILSVLYSLQFPLPGVDSQFVSLNLSDFVIMLIFLTFLTERAITSNWRFTLQLPRITLIYIFASAWIVITVFVAVVREPVSVLPSTLWMLKWLEILVVFILAQQYADEINWNLLVRLLIIGALPIALLTIFQTATTSGWNQPTIFWHNPNTLGVFLTLPSLLCLTLGVTRIRRQPRVGIIALSSAAIFFLGVGATGSRSGMITLLIGVTVVMALVYRQISTKILVGSVVGSFLTGISFLWVTDRMILLRKFFPTIAFQEGILVLSGPGIGGLYTRIDLFFKAVDLWLKQPIFGYGWLASPENPRVGYLDVFYSQLLVDVGLIGLILVLALYLAMAQGFISRRMCSWPHLCAAGAGWVLGMLAAGIGGAHVRVPRLMILLVLLLAAAGHLARGKAGNTSVK